MEEALVDRVRRAIDEAGTLYHRLVLVVGPAGSGKTSTLRKLSALTSAPLINVSLELARRMLDLPERQRPLYVLQLLDEIVGEAVRGLSHGTGAGERSLVLLDNLELLFAVPLQQDPLRLLEGLSRNQTIVAAWSGTIDDGHVTYAVPDHPEYRRYPVRDFLVVGLAESA